MNFNDILKRSAQKTGNCGCMGLDPQIESIPHKGDDIKTAIESFFQELFYEMKKHELYPAAFKPNLGYYAALDKPRENQFAGSNALSSVLDLLENNFPDIPVILDSKRGDIARSSLNYAAEAFDVWKADAVTVSPYMGSDSILPFISKNYEGHGTYILNRTSNPGALDFQNLQDKKGCPLYLNVAKKIAEYAKEFPGTGAVVGATGLEELKNIAEIYSAVEVPMLIPGVGSQGGSAQDVISILKNAGCDLHLIRINSSSALTHPWKNNTVPENFMEVCIKSIKSFLNETCCP